jgi:hypothetical protein
MTDRRDPSPHNLLIRFWCDTYEAHAGAKYPFSGGKDGATIKWLLSLYTIDDVKSYMVAFFEIEDEFIEQSGYSLGVFRGCLPKIIQFVRKGPARPKLHMDTVINHNAGVIEELTGRKLRRVQ